MAPPICLSNIIELDAGFSFVSASQCAGQSPTCNRIRVKRRHKKTSPALQRQGYVECASKLTGTPNFALHASQTLATTSSVRAETSGGSVSKVNGKDATPTTFTPPQSTLPADSISYVATSSNTAGMSGVWPPGARPTGLWPTGTPSKNQRSTSTLPAINDATAINARQTAITSTIFTTILLTQTITSIATAC
ncbi:hypothetical protein BM221_008515 [Beauveria bassiana]|uniref:Uncharacterized protein n=1 Tax=Beauveria bassiana TaxID=176275 RepID=A0A2N6ND50_BEABA|nr:hypothetical protein BM221_008515 [Beauveria bassiana]